MCIRDRDIDRPDEGIFDLLLRDMGRTAGLAAFVLVIALVDDPAIFIRGMPDLRAVPAAAFSALDLGGKHTHAAVAVLVLCPPCHLRLDIIKGGRIDDGFMVALHIVLRDLALVLFRFLLEEVHREILLQDVYKRQR